MGNSNSRGEQRKRSGSKQSNNSPEHSSPTSSAGPSTVLPRGMIRSPSGADIQDKSTVFVPVEKLAKLLAKKNETEFGVSGITAQIFVKYVFPAYPELGERLFNHFYVSSRAKTQHLGVLAFRQQCERFLGILDDQVVVEIYIKMFSDVETDQCTAAGLKTLLTIGFNLAMAYYVVEPKSCPDLESTLNSVLSSCFFQEPLTIGFVTRWINQHCNRLILPIHKFCIHTLSTLYRDLEQHQDLTGAGTGRSGCGLELQTPILEMGSSPLDNKRRFLLSKSVAWLLAGSIPPIYSRPQPILNKDAPANDGQLDDDKIKPSQGFASKFLSVVPSHWTLLYDSNIDGLGANRFLHHVLGYKGPTLIFIKASDQNKKDNIFCIGSSSEWKETHLYTGSEESCLVQLKPKFSIVEAGAKILYLNTSIRGYPKGLRVGVDPRNPIIAIDEHFEKLDIYSITNSLITLEVWGCGDKCSRETQLEIKKWQIKEAERQRTVKFTAADWLDNPDRYLLELGGRPQYNNSSN